MNSIYRNGCKILLLLVIGINLCAQNIDTFRIVSPEAIAGEYPIRSIISTTHWINKSNFQIVTDYDLDSLAFGCTKTMNELTRKIALVDEGGGCSLFKKRSNYGHSGVIICVDDPTISVNFSQQRAVGLIEKSICKLIREHESEGVFVDWFFQEKPVCTDANNFGETCANVIDLGTIIACETAYEEIFTTSYCTDDLPDDSCTPREYGVFWGKFKTDSLMTSIEIGLRSKGFGGHIELYSGNSCGDLKSIDICNSSDTSFLQVFPIDGLEPNTSYFFTAGAKSHGVADGVEVSIIGGACSNVLEGVIYHDQNENGKREPDESTLSNIEIYSNSFNRKSYSNFEGEYRMKFPTIGTYLFDITNVCWKPLNFLDRIYEASEGVFQKRDLPLVLTNNEKESHLDITIIAVGSRCNTVSHLDIHLANNGCEILNGDLHVQLDPLFSVLLDSLPEAAQVIDSLTLSLAYSNLLPSTQQKFVLSGEIADENFIGDTINISATTVYADSSYQSTIDWVIRCAFDPNDKNVLPSRDSPNNYTLIDEFMNYTVRFQNTGTDTALEVIIRDTLSSHLDLRTLEFKGMSHLATIFIDENQVVEFKFTNINLPDSTTDLSGSQGYVNFQIKAKPGTDEFTIIENEAAIYFDRNQPIITNTTNSTIVFSLDNDQDGHYFWLDCDDTNPAVHPQAEDIPDNSIDEDCDGEDNISTSTIDLDSDKLWISPNPTSTHLNIYHTEKGNGVFLLYDIRGTKVLGLKNVNGSYDISHLVKGVYVVQIHFPNSNKEYIRKVLVL